MGQTDKFMPGISNAVEVTVKVRAGSRVYDASAMVAIHRADELAGSVARALARVCSQMEPDRLWRDPVTGEMLNAESAKGSLLAHKRQITENKQYLDQLWEIIDELLASPILAMHQLGHRLASIVPERKSIPVSSDQLRRIQLESGTITVEEFSQGLFQRRNSAWGKGVENGVPGRPDSSTSG